MGPCIVIIFQYISKKMQRYTFYFIWKLLYMFRVVPAPIIKSAYNAIAAGSSKPDDYVLKRSKHGVIIPIY